MIIVEMGNLCKRLGQPATGCFISRGYSLPLFAVTSVTSNKFGSVPIIWPVSHILQRKLRPYHRCTLEPKQVRLLQFEALVHSPSSVICFLPFRGRFRLHSERAPARAPRHLLLLRVPRRHRQQSLPLPAGPAALSPRSHSDPGGPVGHGAARLPEEGIHTDGGTKPPEQGVERQHEVHSGAFGGGDGGQPGTGPEQMDGGAGTSVHGPAICSIYQVRHSLGYFPFKNPFLAASISARSYQF
jgi:hypothetical protein